MAASSGSDQLVLFNQYDSEYCSKATDVARKIEAVAALSGDQRRAKARELDADLKEADQIVKRMEMEARSFSAERSRALMVKVREYRADVAKLRERAREAAAADSGGAAARAELGLGDDWAASNAGQRDRMLRSTERLEQTGDRIKQGRQQLLETEELGVSILTDLHRQRQTITHSRDTLHGADDNIARARKVLASMSRRITTNKLIMGAIILFLLLAIGIVVYSKFRK